MLIAGLYPGAARSEDPDRDRPPVALDRLLELPDSLDYAVERRAGATQGEWRERFRAARAELAEARAALARSQEELAGLGEGSEAWQLAPPGAKAGNTDAPLSYQLKLRIRRQREEVERAEKRLQDLEIEANLANVPASWRE